MIIYCCLSWLVHISHGQTHMAYARLCKYYLQPISYYFKYHRYILHIALSVRRPSCTLLWHANSRAEVSDCKRLTSYICDEKHLGSTRLPGTAGRPSERLILTPLNVQWKVKWLYRPLIIAQAEFESQTSHEYRRTLKWRRGGRFQKKKIKNKRSTLSWYFRLDLLQLPHLLVASWRCRLRCLAFADCVMCVWPSVVCLVLRGLL